MKTSTLKKIAGIALLLAAMQTMSAQNEPSRQVLYTFGPGEEVFHDEYFIKTTANGQKFAMVTHNTRTDKYAFIFNGKRIAVSQPNSSNSTYPFFVTDLDVTRDNGYSMVYYSSTDDKEGYYLYRNGVEEGPFTEVSNFSASSYSYKLAGRWFKKDGSKVTGPYKGGAPACFTKSGLYAFKFEEGGKVYQNINGKIVGPYSKASNPTVTEAGNYSYSYVTDGKSYVNISGRTYGPYENISDVRLTNSGKFAFIFERDKAKIYININDKLYGPYTNIYSPIVTESGNTVFMYQEKNKYYFNINGKVGKAYAESSSLTVTESGNSLFTYKENNYWYVNASGQICGPYMKVANQSITESGKYAFSYTQEGKQYANMNGQIFGPYTEVTSPKITETGKYIFGYKANERYFVNINGKIWGPYTSTSSLSINDTEGYSYVYAVKDGSWYSNKNGKESVLEEFNLPYPTGELELSSADGQHTFYSHLDYEYVVIDGNTIGNSPAMRAWYDRSRNSFIWNAIEGRELVVYEYKIGQ